MKKILTIIFILLGGLIGSVVGEACVGVDGLNWLAIGGTVGFKDPIVLTCMSFFEITFGLWCKLNIGGAIGIILFAFLSDKVLKWVKI
ncbi:MAG: DUF4321 domain-containing protein [Clostridia bacterium]|nr:DUF4321 domain-containing protein [Clostridia bacterium]